MQRWFFLDDHAHKANKPKLEPKKMSTDVTEQQKILTREWKFSVTVNDFLEAQEKVFITGSIPMLGEWDYNKLVPLDQDVENNIWTKTFTFPNDIDIQYRYAICTYNLETNINVIRLWETNIHPREVKEMDLHPTRDIFGEYGGQNRTNRGWLTQHTLVQFKLINNPLKLLSRLAGRPINVKVTPVKLSFNAEMNPDESSHSMDHTSLETDSAIPPGTTVEVSSIDCEISACTLKPQEQFGREYKLNDVMIINVTVLNFDDIAYLVDFYAYSKRAATTDPPCHIGYTYVLPNMFRSSEGTLQLPVTCNVKHRPLGLVNMEYLVIKPMELKLCDLKVSYAKHWDPHWTGLEVGHRGLGASFKTKGGNSIRENTIFSLKKAAASGADLLEFDVQLSKDLVPVIYHDFHVCISMKKKRELDFCEMLELPVKDLTLEHLQKLKVYHLVEGRSHDILVFENEDLEEHQPFPTLEEALKSIDTHVGFNVELKWTMELNDGSFELTNPIDMNTYVDKVLEVVLQHAGDRRIVFSCFNPDICTMVRYKQNKYPVMFLTVGVSSKYKPYRDPRCLSIPAAVQNAISSDILGIVVHTEDLLRDPTQMKLATDVGLVIFCWGEDNNDKNTIKKLKEMGLHAVIYDKLDQYTTKDIKESIFLMEARESQRDVIALAAREEPPAPALSPTASAASTSSRGSGTLPPPEPPAPPAPRPYLDLTVRERIQVQSTATSLESLANSIPESKEPEDSAAGLKRVVITDMCKDTQCKGVDRRQRACSVAAPRPLRRR